MLETFVYPRSGTEKKKFSFPTWHGQHGPIHTSQATCIDQLSPLFVSSALNAGLPRSYDFNDPNNGRYGVGYFDFNIFRGRRDSAAKVFMGSILKSRPFNFHIKLESLVHKVIIERTVDETGDEGTVRGKFEGENIAVGILYEEKQSKCMKKAYLKRSCINGMGDCIQPREIIITAGTLLTPNILMNSGIGSHVLLKNSDVEVKIRNDNVGKNLQDHPAIGFIAAIKSTIAASYPSAYNMAEQWAHYIMAVNSDTNDSRCDKWENCSVNYGILGSAGISTGAFLRSPYTLDAPDIQLTLFPTVSEPHVMKALEKKNMTSKITVGAANHMLITIALLNPEARHDVVLNTYDYFRNLPEIKLPPNRDQYLTDLDIRKLEWAVNRVRDITNAMPLSKVVLKEISPGVGLVGLHTIVITTVCIHSFLTSSTTNQTLL